MRLALPAALALALLAGCEPSGPGPAVDAGPAPLRRGDDAPDAAAPPPQPEPTPSCEARIDAAALTPTSDAHARFAAELPEVLVHGRVTPVFFLDWPDEAPRSEPASAARAAIASARRPTRAIRELVDAHRGDRAFLRDVLLSDGYLFARRPTLARALSAEVRLETLFDDARVFRARDGEIEALVRDAEGAYRDATGRRARLRLHDRVATHEAALAAPLGVDLEVVRARTGALRTLPTASATHAAAFTLVFPDGTRRPALVELVEDRTEVVCVGGDPETLGATTADAARFWERHRRIAGAARLMVDQRVRFDEPIGEPDGVQEDGRLRQGWWQAYRAGRDRYVYRDVEYSVFDETGEARPPQVCIDFVLDAYDRALGVFYRPASEAPGRAPGGFADVPALPRRNVTQLLTHSAGEQSVFDRWDVPRRDRVSPSEGRGYGTAAGRWAQQVREGDLLVIHGLRLQDGRLHNHAVLVLRTEPMTGVPMVVADNQGRARLRSLAGAMRAAPLRSVKHRLRPRFERL